MKSVEEYRQILSCEYRSLLEEPDHFNLEVLSLMTQFRTETISLLMSIYMDELSKMSDSDLEDEYKEMLNYAETARECQ